MLGILLVAIPLAFIIGVLVYARGPAPALIVFGSAVVIAVMVRVGIGILAEYF